LDAPYRHRHWYRGCCFGVVTWNRDKAKNMTTIQYKGYRIEVTPVGKGWRASIYAPSSNAPWPSSPTNLEKSGEEEIVAEAKRIIDERLGPRLM
jgi:hypothetical protein